MTVRSKDLGVATAVALLGSTMVPGIARAAATYEIQFGQEFFDTAGIPGISLRIYPSSVKVMTGDTLHFFGFGGPVLLPGGQVPSEWQEANATFLGDEFFILLPDPDDGPDATKFNPLFIATSDCGSEVDPCEWDGSGDDMLPPGEGDEFYVTITAPPGTVVYGLGGLETHVRIEVVTNPADASTQGELDARAASLLTQDLNTAASLHNRFSTKQTWHRDEKGRKVWDAWAGLDQGPVSLFAMYPKRLSVKKGQRVQWHFNLNSEVHNANFPFKTAKKIANNTFIPSCDPDGDNGPGPDNPANFEAETEADLCPDPSQIEFDLNPREIFGGGDGTFKGSDFEGSGVRGRQRLQDGFWSQDPWTVKFAKASDAKGYRYFCTIHGPFMGGRVVVRG